MARIPPINENELQPPVRAAFERHVQACKAGITNMQATLGHSPLAFEVYMQWCPLYEAVEKILGKRLAYLYAYSIATASDCALTSAFFRKIIIEAGEMPEKLTVTTWQKDVLDFGRGLAKWQGNIRDHLYNSIAGRYSRQEMVVLIAFAGQMIATNVFNNAVETDIDEYLVQYLPVIHYS